MHGIGAFGSIAISDKPLPWHGRSFNRGFKKIMLQDLTDGELINRYLQDSDDQALQILVRRHYDTTWRRFLSHCRHTSDADDLTQQLWMRVINNLESYRDDGRFPAFLNRVSTNLLTDYWRRKGVRGRVMEESNGPDDGDPLAEAPAPASDTLVDCETQQAIDCLTRELIPALPTEQRLVFLLRHESEYWEGKQRLGWNHLAELNGIDEHSAWERFEHARNRLLTRLHGGGAGAEELDGESLLIFLIWTQTQRPLKSGDFTWDYFAELLNVPVNTLKTRYRAALKKLEEGLQKRSLTGSASPGAQNR